MDPWRNFSVLLIVAALIVGGVALYRRHAIQQRQAEERAALETQLPRPSGQLMRTSRSLARNCSGWTSDVAGHALDEPMQQDYQRASTPTTTRRCHWTR